MRLALVSCAAAATDGTQDPADRGYGDVPHYRTFFHVGGKYVQKGNDSGSHVSMNQMYVEELTPAAGETQKHPIALLHGRGQTGTV